MILSIIGSVLLFLIVCLYAALSLGAPLGYLAMGGKDKGVLPKDKRIQTAVSIPAQLLAIFVLLSFGGVFSEPGLVIRIFGYIFSVFFTVNVIMNLMSESKYEKYIMTPIAAIIAFSFIYYVIFPVLVS